MSPVFVAIDTPDVAAATALRQSVRPHVGGIKLGLEFFLANGVEGVNQVVGEGVPLFLDLKLHDIPNTVAGAVRSLGRLKHAPAFLTIHAQGGRAMIEAAVAARDAAVPGLKLLAVTVLTSLDDVDLADIGVSSGSLDQVKRLAYLSVDSGADGCVCSPKEVAALRDMLGSEAALMVPGIRPTGASAGDQKRVMTPRDAMDAGASHLVIGRPITQAADPAAAALAIAQALTAPS